VSWRDLFRSKLGVPALAMPREQQQLVVTPQLPSRRVDHLMESAGIRRGMWVVSTNHVGIALGLLPFGIAGKTDEPLVEVQFVDQLGLNLNRAFEPLVGIRQAAYEDIPEPRRPEKDLARKLGYRT